MRKASWLLLGIAVAFAYGLVLLFQWRFDAGDVYPRYSSLRTDPLGTRALFESFAAIPGISVTRNYRPLARLKSAGATIFFLGVEMDVLMNGDLGDLEDLAKVPKSGARLVVGLLPVLDAPTAGPPPKFELKPWGVTLMLARPDPKRRANLLYFVPTKDWRVIHSAGDHATLIERAFGNGTLVLTADGYPMSNQALLYDRDVKLLSWFAGSNRLLVFDESHLGVAETGSVAELGRRYRLQAFAAVLLLLALLFIWKSSAPLVPPLAGSFPPPVSPSSGMPPYLLRRAMPPAQVISACLEEWRKSLSLGPRYSSVRLQRVEEIASAEPDPVKAYRAIGHALAGEK